MKTVGTAFVTCNINNSEIVFVDARQDYLYNGYEDTRSGSKGHLINAVQFPIEWIKEINSAKKSSFLEQKGIVFDKTIVIYDSDLKRLKVMADFLIGEMNYSDVYIFDNLKELYSQNSELFYSFPGYNLWIDSPQLLQMIKEDDDFLLLEASREDVDRNYEDDYKREHIPKAISFDIDKIESLPDWNIHNFDVIKNVLESYGIDQDKRIVIYSKNTSAAFRVGLTLLWAGIDNFSILNGGYNVWKKMKYPVEKTENTPQHIGNMRNDVPLNPDLLVREAEQIYDMQVEENYKLVSIRSWDEFIGNTSGYESLPEIDDKLRKGEPREAIWGFSGEKIRQMEDYIDPDLTLRNPHEIEHLWLNQGITKEDNVAFYCGTGWRASLAFFYSLILGYEKTLLFDGGWHAWVNHGKLPVDGSREKKSKPDSLNNYI